jgi:trk system potassium uptake protein TrkH
VGPAETYAWFGAPAKMLLCGLRLLGRLEVFAVLVLFMPSFWQRT